MFRYPGGKSKLKKNIINAIREYYHKNNCFDSCRYVEPFFGAGAIGLTFVEEYQDIKKMSFNDYDVGIASFWNAVISDPDELCKLIEKFTPSVEYFYKFKKQLLKSNLKSGVRTAFKKIAIHQMSYSGLGTMAGGPIGGENQTSKYKVDCRWNATNLINKVKKYNRLLRKVDLFKNCFLNEDFALIFKMFKDEECFYYLDPPYYEKGEELYQCCFDDKDHERLAKILKNSKHPWFLSYDDNPVIRHLYDWAFIGEVKISCTINTMKGSKRKSEFLIVPKSLSYILEEKNDVINFEM